MKKSCIDCGEEFDIKPNNNRKYCFICSPKVNPSSRNASFKACKICHRDLPNTKEFFKVRKRDILRTICRECSNKKNAISRKKVKSKALAIYGKNECEICGYDKCYEALSFHHKDPSTKDNQIGFMWYIGLEEEIKKCILVCENCHKEIHAGLHPDILIVEFSTNIKTVRGRVDSIRRKEERVNYLGGKCLKCHYHKYLGSLQFHHKDESSKHFTISRKNVVFENIKDELDKCELLCANCHMEKHHKEDHL